MSTNLDSPNLDVKKEDQRTEVPPTNNEAAEVARQQAIKQIKRRRNFHIELVVSGIGMVILVMIWATSEYHNAGGWPTQGFSQSSGIHDVWNYWIIYPVIAWVLIISGRAWRLHSRRGISESEIKREMERNAGNR